MPVVLNNSFSEDTYGMRTERLTAIQGNFDSIQVELAAPAEIATWAEDCMDIFTDLLAVSNVEKNESESATMEVNEFEELMVEEYQNSRTLALAIFVDHPKLYEQFDFETVFPKRRNDKYNRVKSILTTYDRFVADGTVPNLPAAVMTRLKNAMDGFDAALVKQDKERGESGMALAALSVCFEKDTKMLNKLKSWWFAMLGKKDPRITWVGMVNPQPGGSNKVPAAPTGLGFFFPNTNFFWDAVNNATSYNLEASTDGTDFFEIYSGAEPEFSYTPIQEGWMWYRVRARNAGGFGPFSEVFQLGYYPGSQLPTPVNLALQVETGTTNSLKLTWDVVPSATKYSVNKSVVPIGAAAGPFNLAKNVYSNEYFEEVDAGHRYYYNLTASNGNQWSSVSSNVFIDMP